MFQSNSRRIKDMMLIINDENKCPECGAYYQHDNYCVNGHLKEEKTESCMFCRYLEVSPSSIEKGQCKCVSSKFYIGVSENPSPCGRG